MFAPKAASLVADSCTADVAMPGLVGWNESLPVPEIAGVVADASMGFAASAFVDGGFVGGWNTRSSSVTSPGLVPAPMPAEVSCRLMLDLLTDDEIEFPDSDANPD